MDKPHYIDVNNYAVKDDDGNSIPLEKRQEIEDKMKLWAERIIRAMEGK